MKSLYEPVAVRCCCFSPEAAFRERVIGISEKAETIYTKSEYLAAKKPGSDCESRFPGIES